MNSLPDRYQKHLDATMEWIANAQRCNGGFSAAYSYFKGWTLPYPETTGYIIETILRYSSVNSTRDWKKVIANAGEWLLNLEISSGGFPAAYGLVKIPRVFNTGMILFGLASLYQLSNDDRYKTAGLRTISWLREIQNRDGSWTIASLEGKPHAYQSRVAWGILKMADALDLLDEYVPVIALANDWVVSQQNPDDWFENNDLIPGLPPLTHNIAYAIRGLLECGQHLRREDWLSSAIRSAQPVLSDWNQSGTLASSYGPGWQRGPSFRCVTGEAQFGVIWYRLWQITGEKKWLSAAHGIADQVAQIQPLRHILPGVRGGVPGSWPIWERYLRFSYPNWAAKFFADLLLSLIGK